ncbi:ABC transporter permease [Streptomyces sp. NEAU-H3]|uniref:ABC transporter permease n=1 Tax=Streptomyces sp. NEAU-H3 TaxID=2720636 RepID=UPI001438A0A1|nr:ABC transporter permease [Streptomyces sp. NEAU-H3]NJA59892.1 ABC transporter permease [Streptomyces sp. NEAU-H3]
MTRFLLRRLVGALLVLLLLSALVYALFYVIPGNVAQTICGPRCSPAQVAQVHDRLGLGDPVWAQYWHFLQGIFAGRDYSTGTGSEHCGAPCLGMSYRSGQPVTTLIADKLPVSGSLVVGAFVLWLVLGVGTGILSAWRRGRPTERVLTGITLAGTATPVPFPTYVPFGQDPEQWAWNLVLPWFSLALIESAKYARLTRGAMLETLAEDHVRTFRAYGVSERSLVVRHALRGARAPVIAMSALDVGTMFGGATLTESLFGIPGLGRALVQAVQVSDLPVVVGAVLVIGFFVVLANAVADVLYVVADRRVTLA